VIFVVTKKCRTTNFFSTLSFVAVFESGIQDPGSGMDKNQDPGSASLVLGILKKDLQHLFVDGSGNPAQPLFIFS
jgi:hypothetical protein